MARSVRISHVVGRRGRVLATRSQATLEGAQRAAMTKVGASRLVAPRKVPGLPHSDQPFACAARLEFGDAHRPTEPSARAAFDVARERAVRAAGDVLGMAAQGVAR
jgi:hypothetical protein